MRAYQLHEDVNEVEIAVQGRDRPIRLKRTKDKKNPTFTTNDPGEAVALEEHPAIKRVAQRGKSEKTSTRARAKTDAPVVHEPAAGDSSHDATDS